LSKIICRFLIEHGACIFATTTSDQETALEKCEPEDEGFDGCSKYLMDIQVIFLEAFSSQCTHF